MLCSCLPGALRCAGASRVVLGDAALLLAEMALGFLLPALGPEQIVPLRGWFFSSKNPVLSSGILLAED